MPQTQTASTGGGESFAALFEESLKSADMRVGEVISAEVVRIDFNHVVVNAGLGKGAEFTRLDWVRRQLVALAGIDPHPGTANLELRSALQQAHLRIQRMSNEPHTVHSAPSAPAVHLRPENRSSEDPEASETV